MKSEYSYPIGEPGKKWQEVEEVSIVALQKRIGLWNAIEEAITKKMEFI